MDWREHKKRFLDQLANLIVTEAEQALQYMPLALLDTSGEEARALKAWAQALEALTTFMVTQGKLQEAQEQTRVPVA